MVEEGERKDYLLFGIVGFALIIPYQVTFLL